MSDLGKAGKRAEVTAEKSRGGILVVEDDKTHRLLMERILQEGGFSVTPAESGYVALAKLTGGQSFDLIIMDWDMPGLNGLDTVREIRNRQANGSLPAIPVIAFTSNRMPGDREKCLAAGMDAYLPKDVWLPKWRETLIGNLQGLMEGNFNIEDFTPTPANEEALPVSERRGVDLDLFDERTFEKTAALLKDELAIAIEEYLEDAAAYIRDIKQGLENNDAEQVARGSHPLKSNSRGFGLMAVSQIAETINHISREATDKGALAPLPPMLAQLQEAFSRAEKRLRAAIAKSGY